MPNAGEQEQRIEKAAKVMKAIFKKQKMTAQQLKAADGIIKRVAFMQVTLEDLEADMNQNGTTEMFSQTPGVKYQRERPASAIYNRTIKNYTTACKQLFDLIPEQPNGGATLTADEKELLQMMKAGRR